jgi:hypothetical protein
MKSKFEFTQEYMSELLDWLMEVVDLIDFNHEEHAAGTDIANDQINTDREVNPDPDPIRNYNLLITSD